MNYLFISLLKPLKNLVGLKNKNPPKLTGFKN